MGMWGFSSGSLMLLTNNCWRDFQLNEFTSFWLTMWPWRPIIPQQASVSPVITEEKSHRPSFSGDPHWRCYPVREPSRTLFLFLGQWVGRPGPWLLSEIPGMWELPREEAEPFVRWPRASGEGRVQSPSLCPLTQGVCHQGPCWPQAGPMTGKQGRQMRFQKGKKLCIYISLRKEGAGNATEPGGLNSRGWWWDGWFEPTTWLVKEAPTCAHCGYWERTRVLLQAIWWKVGEPVLE